MDWYPLWNSLRIALISCAAVFFLGIFAAYYIARLPRVVKGVLDVLLTLPDDTQRYPVAGKVAWVTPARAGGNRTQGVGIQFPKDDKSRQLKLKIEEILGTALGSDKLTQTI